MKTECFHTEDQKLFCNTCKKLLCIDCALDKVNGHRLHDNITFKAIVLNYRTEISLKKNLSRQRMNDFVKKLNRLTIQKNKLLTKNTDNNLVLDHCSTHSTNCEAYCTTCKEPVCIRCIIQSTHKNHDIKMVSDYLPTIRSEFSAQIASLTGEITKYNQIIEHHQKILNELSVEITDQEIIDDYIYANTSNILIELQNKFEIYPIEFAQPNGLVWSGQYQLFTDDSSHCLTPGYYLMIAVGGGGAGGIKFKLDRCYMNGCPDYFLGGGGGGSGYITANIVKVMSDTKIDIKVGTGGRRYYQYVPTKNTHHYQTTSIVIDNTEIIAKGGEAPFEIFYKNDGSIDDNKTCSQMKDSYVHIYASYMHGHYITYIYGGKGFSGGGHVEGKGGSNGNKGSISYYSNSISKYNPTLEFYEYKDMKKIADEELYTHEKYTNGSGSILMTLINKLFPLAFPGKGGFFDNNHRFRPGTVDYGGEKAYVTNIINGPGCGGGGLCLTNHPNYLSNKQKLSPFEEMIASQGFGAGGRGMTLAGGGFRVKDRSGTAPIATEGTNGMDGCVIIVPLI